MGQHLERLAREGRVREVDPGRFLAQPSAGRVGEALG